MIKGKIVMNLDGTEAKFVEDESGNIQLFLEEGCQGQLRRGYKWVDGFDPVNKPSHYNQGGIECIDAISVAVYKLEGMEAVYTANVIKYMWRWKHKNGVEDLKKAKQYLEWLIKKVENEG